MTIPDSLEAIAPASGSGARRIVITGVLAAGAFAVGLWLLPVDSDGAFAINDGVHYGAGAEVGDHSIISRHPLFHLIAVPVTRWLRDFGVLHPGHVAIRIIAGLGAAWLVVQITLLAGSKRWFVGLLCACFALSCRFVMLETGAGETVVIATAASLTAFALVARPNPTWLGVGAAFVLALLFRQDNVLAAPGMALLMWTRLPQGRRFIGTAAFFLVTGAVTIGLYVLMWRLNDDGDTFEHWLFAASHTGLWGLGLTADRMLAHLDTLGEATVGGFWTWNDPQHWVGPAVLTVAALSGLLFRGGPSFARFAAALLLTVVIRFLFHSWWVPMPQFHVYNIAAIAAAAAFAAREESAPLPERARIGMAMLSTLTLATLLCHWPSTSMLRQRRLMESALYAQAAAPPGSSFMARGSAAGTALGLLGIQPTWMPHDWADIKRMVGEALSNTRPVVVFFDRFTLGNHPEALVRPGRYDQELDNLAPLPNMRLLRVDGLVVACVFGP